MKQETKMYPFPDKVLFVGESDAGVCLICCKRIFVESINGFQEIIPNRHYKEGYVLNEDKLLLVEICNSGLTNEIFSFSLCILDLKSGVMESQKDFKSCDYRGLKVKGEHVILGLNKYDSNRMANLDLDGLSYDPPCPECAEYSEVIYLDFLLNELRSVQHDDCLPDDLLIYVGGIGNEDVILFNHDKQFPFNQFICRIGDTTYGVREGFQLIKYDKDGIASEIFEIETEIVGVGLTLDKSLPEFRIYLEDKLLTLSPGNTLRFILL